MSGKIVLLGSGSHARVVLDLLREAGRGRLLAGAIDLCRDAEAPLGSLDGLPILGGIDLGRPAREGSGTPALDLDPLRRRGIRRAVPAIGDNALRMRAAAWATRSGLALLSAIHPDATVSRRASIAPGAVLCARSFAGTGSRIGEGAIVNTGALVDHDARVGDYAHVAPGARLAGRVIVGERAWVGLGASVREGIRIGKGAVVGAGAVVVKSVPAGFAVVGIPARPLREKH